MSFSTPFLIEDLHCLKPLESRDQNLRLKGQSNEQACGY